MLINSFFAHVAFCLLDTGVQCLFLKKFFENRVIKILRFSIPSHSSIVKVHNMEEGFGAHSSQHADVSKNNASLSLFGVSFVHGCADFENLPRPLCDAEDV